MPSRWVPSWESSKHGHLLLSWMDGCLGSGWEDRGVESGGELKPAPYPLSTSSPCLGLAARGPAELLLQLERRDGLLRPSALLLP